MLTADAMCYPQKAETSEGDMLMNNLVGNIKIARETLRIVREGPESQEADGPKREKGGE